jgi:hypothetical protein
MSPTFILVMRHAQKPKGDPIDPDLSADGQIRAEKLASYIPANFTSPAFIFAAAISRHSARPYETVKPLSKSIGLPIDATIADQDYEALAAELLTKNRCDGAGVVVCWHHGNIPSRMHALGAEPGDYPNPWDPDVFNLILKLGFSNAGPPSITKITEPF